MQQKKQKKLIRISLTPSPYNADTSHVPDKERIWFDSLHTYSAKRRMPFFCACTPLLHPL